jgi:hypothetical protein
MKQINGMFAAMTLALLSTTAQVARAGDGDNVRRAPDVGNAIASQGNAALVQIRSESTRLPLPSLNGVARAPQLESSAGDAQALEQVRTRARIASLRRGVFTSSYRAQR